MLILFQVLPWSFAMLSKHGFVIHFSRLPIRNHDPAEQDRLRLERFAAQPIQPDIVHRLRFQIAEKQREGIPLGQSPFWSAAFRRVSPSPPARYVHLDQLHPPPARVAACLCRFEFEYLAFERLKMLTPNILQLDPLHSRYTRKFIPGAGAAAAGRPIHCENAAVY